MAICEGSTDVDSPGFHSLMPDGQLVVAGGWASVFIPHSEPMFDNGEDNLWPI